MPPVIDTLRLDREEILAISHHYHASNVRLFGSVVRGDERTDSDVDLLVDFQSDSTILDQIGLIEALTSKLGRKVDVISSRALNRHLAHIIQKEAVPL